jgi:nucleoside 2-deoxyribosyltransferase
MKVYVASSWRCKYQQSVVELLRSYGLDVYDFRNPGPGEHGFGWSEINPDWLAWQPEIFRRCLDHKRAVKGFSLDMTALRECDACLCVLPCGRSAHLELGWASGAGKQTAIYMPPEEKHEPELMYKMLGSILVSETELNKWAQEISMVCRLH